MRLDLSDLHVLHVLAAYAAAAILVGGLALFSWRAHRRARD